MTNDDTQRTSDLARIRPKRRRSLPDEIVDQLLELITESGTQEYRLPPERALSDRLGVSRTSLREALAALAQLGVLETRGKAKLGVTARAHAQLVARRSDDSEDRSLVADPIDVRRILEPEAAARAAERGSDADFDDIAEWLRLMENAAARGESLIDYDSAFHVAIARAAGNQTLVHLVSALTDALRDIRELSFRPTDASQTAIADHHEIISALRARDPRAARRAMRRHLDHVELLVRASLVDGR
jgi:GntR family transcriptional repressor for pyruvate dehydrogenase complex